jgi:hypothetical protein
MKTSKTTLAKAISLVMAGVAISAGSVSTVSAHTMYNTFTTTEDSATDGWTRTAPDANGIASGPASNGNSGSFVPWLGTPGKALPFGYTGSAIVNWAAAVHHAGTMEISTADAIANFGRAGRAVEIDTGAGAWKDAGAPATATTPAVAPTGWKHQTDIGLIKADSDMTIRLNLTTIGGINNNFGVTVFEGMDTTTANYSHHGGWNNASKPETTSNPFYAAGVGSGMNYLTHSATVTNSAFNYVEFFAKAGQVYSIALGGNGVGRWNENVADYKLTISSSAVPVPGAVWLFGSALAGFIGMRRSKATA